jgi:hypothetical protein
MSTSSILNKLLYLRPCELSRYMTTIKILKKYNKLDSHVVETHYQVFSELLKDTPYPFCWNMGYDRKENSKNYILKNEGLALEKKVLFDFHQNKINILTILKK